jgi:hypothetical protein
MRLSRVKWFCYLLFLFLITGSFSIAQTNLQTTDNGKNHDPDKARLITSDIDNFWRAYDLASKETDAEKKKEIFQREYYDKGSQGLKDFITLRLNKVESFVATLSKYPLYYGSIRQESLKVNSMKSQITRSLRKLKTLYPDAVFPDVYFVIGKLSSGGTTSKNGLLIGTEMYCRTSATPEAELGEWLKQVLKSMNALPAIVAHEIIHFEQNNAASNTLLSQSINEGAADFISEMIAGQMINPHLHSFGNPRERELWEEFKREMHGKVMLKWLYNGSAIKDRPADLGYYMGYKICEAYYKEAKNKKQAIKDLLNIKDFEAFLKDSQYEKKFASK